ncbi:hypothetical protein [Halopiger djelfimassiliensis]|uniref:hypothetical protein n=1 Tax=Halopiger djelfimassiliensis TaxID=1293047 RepID=UPI000AF7918E|nr:hypothetical protein [Halopiger djelfimassiliensis]
MADASVDEESPTDTSSGPSTAPAGRQTRRRAITWLVAALFVGSVLGCSVAGVAATSSPSLLSSGSIADQSTNTSETHVVVRFADDHVVTETVADETPSDPNVTAGGERLVVVDGVVETEDGDAIEVDGNQVRVAETDPNLVVTDGNVLNDTMEVDRSDNGIVKTVEGGSPVRTEDGTAVRFTGYDETDFVPNITDVNRPGEGETLSVTAEFENTEYGEATRDVTLQLLEDGAKRANVTSDVSLAAGESTTKTFEYETTAGDHGIDELEVVVDYDGNVDSEPVTIDEAATLVSITDWTQPAAGDELEVTAEIDRRGNYPEGTQEFLIELRVDDSHVTTKPVELAPGGKAVETFSYETSEADSPRVDVELKSGDDADTATIDVLGQATHEESVSATIVDRNLPNEGEDLEITGQIEYTGVVPDDPQEYPIELYVDGDLADEKTVTLHGDEVVTETFTYRTESGDAPRVDVDLVSPGDGDSARPRVNGSGFDVRIESINAPVNASERLEAVVSIENTGDVAGKQNVRMRIDSAIDDPDRTVRHVRDRTTVSLEVGERTTERLSYRTSSADTPKVEVAVLSDDAEAVRNATVRAKAPRFGVHRTAAEYAEQSGELTLSADINNTGTEPGDQYVEFLLDGEVVYVDRVVLDPWAEKTVSTTIEPDGLGAYDFEVVTENETASDVAAVGVKPDDEPEPDSDAAPNDSADGEVDPDDESDESSLPWWLLFPGILVVVVSAVVVLVYRHDPDEFPPDPADVPTAVREEASASAAAAKRHATRLVAALKAGDTDAVLAAVKTLVGLGTGTLIVQNDLPKETTVRVRCQTAEETVLLEDLQLRPEERRDLGSLPNVDQFKVGAGVEDITAHEEVFQGISGDVGVVLRAEGIVIANLT